MNSKLILVTLLGFSINMQAQVNLAAKKAYSPESGGRMLPAAGYEKQLPHSANIRIEEEEQPVSPLALTFVDTFYSFDFSSLDGVVRSPETGANGYWEIGTHDQIGIGYFRLIDSLATFQSTSAANGYAMFDSDGFGEGTINDASLTIGPFSIPELQNDTNDITLNFEQWYMRFRDTASVWISTNGVNFTKIGDNLGIGVNVITANPRLKFFRITQYAGEESVYIRFHYKGSWDYSWLIDDITVTETVMSGVDLRPVRLLCGDYIRHWNYTHIPLAQADSIGFSAIVENIGYKTGSYSVLYEITKGQQTVHTGSLEKQRTLNAGRRDTIGHVTGYVPTDTGTYVIRLTFEVAEGDDEPDNNSASVSQFITDKLYSPVSSLDYIMSLNTESGPPYQYFYVAQFFEMKRDQQVTGIQAFFWKDDGFTGTQEFELVIYETEENALIPKQDPIPDAITSFRMDASYTPGWTNFEFDRPVQLHAGKTYVASINSYGSDKIFWYTYRQDGDLDMGTIYYAIPENETQHRWARFFFRNLPEIRRVSPAIRLNLAPTVIGIDETRTGIQLDAYPVPASNLLNVHMKLSTPSTFELRLTDMNGRVVFHKKNTSKVSLYNEPISLEQIADGFYTLQVISTEGITAKKVVIAR